MLAMGLINLAAHPSYPRSNFKSGIGPSSLYKLPRKINRAKSTTLTIHTSQFPRWRLRSPKRRRRDPARCVQLLLGLQLELWKLVRFPHHESSVCSINLLSSYYLSCRMYVSTASSLVLKIRTPLLFLASQNLGIRNG